MEREELWEQVELVDTSLRFLGLIVLAVLLSFWATLRQRQGICLRIQGEEAAAGQVGEVGSIRTVAGALVVGALGYFFWLAWTLWEEDPGGAARSELWASALALAAVLIRWRALERAETGGGI